MAAGGLKAAEVNVGRSVTERNPVSIVAGLAERYVHHLCHALGLGKCAMPCSKWSSYERGVVKWNEGRNERSGMKDTEAAVTNAV